MNHQETAAEFSHRRGTSPFEPSSTAVDSNLEGTRPNTALESNPWSPTISHVYLDHRPFGLSWLDYTAIPELQDTQTGNNSGISKNIFRGDIRMKRGTFAEVASCGCDLN